FVAGRTLLSTVGEPPRRFVLLSRRNMSYKFETLAVSTPSDHVFHVELNRPEKLNAMNVAFWEELPKCFRQLNDDRTCRAVIISGAGKMFTAGLDFKSMTGQLMQPGSGDDEEPDVARKARHLHNLITSYQATFTSIEKAVLPCCVQCSKPVIAAVHNGCIGGGVNLITACDMRYCTSDAYFQIKEVELGLAADVGVLQRLPRVIGNRSLVNELVFTARKMEAAEAREAGLVSRIFPDKAQMLSAALTVAKEIASKSPVAVQGSKVNLVYSRDHGVDEALHFMACWNMSMLQSEDVVKAVMALVEKAKEPPKFSNL
ncbi:unnamed protein product, partial [Ixodes hexagonus]